MFLLNHQLINNYVNNNSSILDIWEFKLENLQHTFYYFRLGSEGLINGNPFKLTNESNNRLLTLQPDDFAIIKTHETFTISEKLIAIFGQSSDLTKKGLQLIHSPFVDPKFRGKLELGIKNINNKPISLEYKKHIIGKISFFDISDTYPIVINPNSKIAKKFISRAPERDDESLHALFDGDDDQ